MIISNNNEDMVAHYTPKDQMLIRLNNLKLHSGQLGEDPRFLIEGVLAEKSLNMFYAKGGSGKSFLTLALSIELIEKRLVSSVIYMDMDNSLTALKQRNLEQWFEKYPQLNYIHTSKLEGQPFELLEYLVSQTNYQPDMFEGVLIVFDSIRDFILGRDMNSDRDIAPVMQKLKVLREAGATVIFLHHTTKEGDGTNYKGSTSFRDSVDISYSLSSERRDNTLNFSLTLDKDRLGVKERVGFELDTKTMVLQSINPQLATMEEHPLEFVNEVKEALDESQEGLNQSQLLESIGRDSSDKTARKYLKEFAGKFWTSKKVPQKNNQIFYFALGNEQTLPSAA
jgi:hypothetical protein